MVLAVVFAKKPKNVYVRESPRVELHESFLQLSATIISLRPNERKLSTTLKKKLTRFKFDQSARESTRVVESACQSQTRVRIYYS